MLKKLSILLILIFNTVAVFSQGIPVRKMSTSVEFVVNTDTIIENYGYECYVEKVLPYIFEHADEIETVLLIGSASPEGNYESNVNLARRRVDKISSYLNGIIPSYKIVKSCDYNLFLNKTGLDESDYARLRATYVEVYFSCDLKRNVMVDTIRRTVVDSVVIKRNTVVENFSRTDGGKCGEKLALSIYNDLCGDLIKRANIGAEVYFGKFSAFVDGYFSSATLIGKTYCSDAFHAGVRKYFNNEYNKVFIEIYGRFLYFDTDLFRDNGIYGITYGGGLGIGYKFNLCTHWKIYPSIRFGFDRFYYKDYTGNGNVNVSFGRYVDGQGVESAEGEAISVTPETITDRAIDGSFFDSSGRGVWIGPTYFGITLQRDFHFRKR